MVGLSSKDHSFPSMSLKKLFSLTLYLFVETIHDFAKIIPIDPSELLSSASKIQENLNEILDLNRLGEEDQEILLKKISFLFSGIKEMHFCLTKLIKKQPQSESKTQNLSSLPYSHWVSLKENNLNNRIERLFH